MEENIIKKGAANWNRTGSGGHLYLTDTELIFKPHSLNFSKREFVCDLKDIINVTSFGINNLGITLDDDSKESFRVNGKTEWVNALNKYVDNKSIKKVKLKEENKKDTETVEIITKERTDNQDTNTNNNSAGLGCLVIIIIFAVIFIISLFNRGSGSSAEVTMENEFRKGVAGLISANQIDKVDCNVNEDDGNGRYLLYCSIAYYPMKNGAIDMTSKIDSGLHVVYKSNGGNYYRKYAYSGREDLKRSSCWGQSSEKNLSC